MFPVFAKPSPRPVPALLLLAGVQARCLVRVVRAPDCSPLSAGLARRCLRASGYRVVKAPTSIAAYQIAIAVRTDIVVTDVHFTGSMSGLELTRRLRTHLRTTAVPVIVLTDVSRPQDADLALKAGANRVLERPVWAAVLCQEIERLLAASAPHGGRRRHLEG